MATGEDRTGPARARGLTLIEVLIALGIVLALTAIVLPTAAWALRLGALESARDGIEATLLQARAHARLSGRSIEVRLTDDRLEASWFEPRGDALESGEAAEFGNQSDLRIPAPWARRRLPSEIEVKSWTEFQERLNPLDPLDPLELPLPNELKDPGIATDSELPIRLAVLLPDGGALTGTPIVLIGENDDALLIQVDSWTGRPVIEEPPKEVPELLPEVEPDLETEREFPELAP